MAVNKHPCFISLEPGTTIWRYMDLQKFKSLLETKSLFFCRADKFSDPFEGSIPKREAENRPKEFWKIAQSPGYNFGHKEVEENIQILQSGHRKFKTKCIVNCWHINNSESDAMWKLYLKSNEGVAIQSTTERILKTIDEIPEIISLSKVRYLDYEKDIWYHPVKYPHIGYNTYSPLIHKRIEFVHENEFRLFHEVNEAYDDEYYWDRQRNNVGQLIPVNLISLIEKIYLPPTIDKKTSLAIEQLSKLHEYSFKFQKSKLSEEPFY